MMIPEQSPDRKPPADDPGKPPRSPEPPAEIGGPEGLEPTRYGDWERKGRCTDF
jgi:hypothetical protein